MTDARFLLSTHGMPLPEAEALAERFDSHIAIDALAVTVNEVDEAQGLWAVTAYFAEESEAQAAATALVLTNASIAPVPQVDWVRQSLEGLAPVIAGRFFLHGSHDRARRRAGGISLEVDAGTAFGTGHHGTTAGCLLALDAILKRKQPRRIFDLGCGTGVLAIAAARATRRSVLATDIDPEAVRVTTLNAGINGLAPLLRTATAAGLRHPAIRAAAPYDLIFANILARPLAALAPGLTALLAPGGRVILSGLTRDQQRWIKACYLARGLVHERSLILGNWVALVMARPPQKQKRPAPEGTKRFSSLQRAPGWEHDL